MQEILLFGGSFDPVHNGHLIVSRFIAEKFAIEKVILVPAATPPHKPPTHATSGQRLEMLRLAVAGYKLYEIDEIELNQTGPSYTFDTVTRLQQKYGTVKFKWLIGADMLADLPKWHRVNELLGIVDFVIACRSPISQKIMEVLGELEKSFSHNQVIQLRKSLVETPVIDISSSDIRRRIAAGLSISFLLPPDVEKYIPEKGLYKKH